jgi:hypothetical protein
MKPANYYLDLDEATASDQDVTDLVMSSVLTRMLTVVRIVSKSLLLK